ncbi:DUF4097 family beta strand repeat-containing protein [Nocardioides sp. T2.26MG-1]|uniref:DUF4097 family beta strand repeat-containing protein n=1 Tax=Nocardioides sp. T2.26MG-1 TaxID=3041166 RepID=UPI002477C461|nr:DUF4097 family beta strand repeat-containing protein [Nocardioides sp. T2.26MG-1]CAI9412012.1 Protein LiaG [Nocardioides sp. T2.26MG-1]
MTEHHFETHQPVRLVAEIGKGSVKVAATDTTETHVVVTGRDADQTVVRQDGSQISVVGPKQRGGIFGGDSRLDVVVTLPTSSDLAVRTGSANIMVTGTVGTAQLKSGSGDVEVDTGAGPLVVETGSGDIRIEAARADLKAKSGSGDVLVVDAAASVLVSTGSGDVQLWATRGSAVVKTGSGDLKVGESEGDVALTTGSGDLVVSKALRGRVTVKGASGDVAVGVPAGVPVWTDISTITGEIRSNLSGAGEPRDGADHVEVRAKTVSGDIVLTQA